MPVIGSSSVVPPGSVMGPKGLRGLTGSTGPAGTGGTGPTGPTGATGAFVFSGRTEDDNLILVLSDGKEFTIEGLKGPTGEVAAAGAITGDSGTNPVSIFRNITDGITFYFRGITAEGTLTSYQTDDLIGISGDIIYKEGVTADGMIRNRFSYISAGASADSTGLTFDSLGTVYFSETGGATGYSYDPEEIVVRVPSMPLFEMDGVTPKIYGITGGVLNEWYTGPTCGGGAGMIMDVKHGSVFRIETPIGIQGFTGDFSSNEVFNFTMHLGGYDIWDWPGNIYFDENELYFSCGWDIINFLTNDGGDTWKANIASRAYGVDKCFGSVGLGSCCHLDMDEPLEWLGDEDDVRPHSKILCIDYMSENDCAQLYSPYDLDGEPTLGGSWNQFMSCDDGCGSDGDAPGVCCSDGGNWGGYSKTAVCIENVGADECNNFGATYWTHIYYQNNLFTGISELIPTGPVPITCDMDLSDYGYGGGAGWPCINPCAGSIACCKDGECIGDSLGNGDTHGEKLPPLTAAACELVYGGVASVGSCSSTSVDCCDTTPYIGACCESANTGIPGDRVCRDNVLRKVCLDNESNVFMGPGTECTGQNAVDCCGGVIGACCVANLGACTHTVAADCPYPNVFGGEGTACGVNDFCIPPPGACCSPDGHCMDDQLFINCQNSGGTWRGPYTRCCE
jgi:hypothetical protein